MLTDDQKIRFGDFRQLLAEAVIESRLAGFPRLQKIAQRRCSGATLGQIGAEEHITRERVRQLLLKGLHIMAPRVTSQHISQLGLCTRTQGALLRHGVDTVGALAQMTDKELLDVRNFGVKALAEVRRVVMLENSRG